MQASGWSGHRATLAGVYGLVTVPVGGGVFARDVRWERDVSGKLQLREEIVHRNEPNLAFAELAARDDLGLKFVMVAEEQLLADADLAARPDEALPLVGICADLACEQDLDATLEEIVRGWIVRT